MADFSPRAWPVGPRQISGLVFIFRCKVISTTETVTLQMWWMSNFGNAMARNMKIRSGRNPYELVLVQSAQHLQESGSYTLNSERKKISTSSQPPLACVLLLLAVFWCHLVNFPSENLTRLLPARSEVSTMTAKMSVFRPLGRKYFFLPF